MEVTATGTYAGLTYAHCAKRSGKARSTYSLRFLSTQLLGIWCSDSLLIDQAGCAFPVLKLCVCKVAACAESEGHCVVRRQAVLRTYIRRRAYKYNVARQRFSV